MQPNESQNFQNYLLRWHGRRVPWVILRFLRHLNHKWIKLKVHFWVQLSVETIHHWLQLHEVVLIPTLLWHLRWRHVQWEVQRRFHDLVYRRINIKSLFELKMKLLVITAIYSDMKWRISFIICSINIGSTFYEEFCDICITWIYQRWQKIQCFLYPNGGNFLNFIQARGDFCF